MGLHCSCVSRRARSEAFASITSAMALSTFLRSSSDFALQAGKAALAAATASLSCASEARGQAATGSSVAGFTTLDVFAPSTSFPLMRSLYSLMPSILPLNSVRRSALIIEAGRRLAPSGLIDDSEIADGQYVPVRSSGSEAWCDDDTDALILSPPNRSQAACRRVI